MVDRAAVLEEGMARLLQGSPDVKNLWLYDRRWWTSVRFSKPPLWPRQPLRCLPMALVASRGGCLPPLPWPPLALPMLVGALGQCAHGTLLCSGAGGLHLPLELAPTMANESGGQVDHHRHGGVLAVIAHGTVLTGREAR